MHFELDYWFSIRIYDIIFCCCGIIVATCKLRKVLPLEVFFWLIKLCRRDIHYFLIKLCRENADS